MKLLKFDFHRLKGRRRNFTLIELVVAITIFSLIGVGVGSSFIYGMKLWRRIEKENFPSKVILTFEKFSQDLFNSLKFPIIGFEGEENILRFPALMRDFIVEVAYEFNQSNNLLIRRERTLKDFLEENQEFKENPILSLEELRLSYLYFDKDEQKYMWKNSWKEEEGIPKGIKIEIRNKYGVFEKKIFLPIS